MYTDKNEKSRSSFRLLPLLILYNTIILVPIHPKKTANELPHTNFLLSISSPDCRLKNIISYHRNPTPGPLLFSTQKTKFPFPFFPPPPQLLAAPAPAPLVLLLELPLLIFVRPEPVLHLDAHLSIPPPSNHVLRFLH